MRKRILQGMEKDQKASQEFASPLNGKRRLNERLGESIWNEFCGEDESVDCSNLIDKLENSDHLDKKTLATIKEQLPVEPKGVITKEEFLSLEFNISSP